MKIFVKSEYLVLLHNFCSTEQNRWYLNGIYFEKGGTIVATDGHQIGYIDKVGFTTDNDDYFSDGGYICKFYPAFIRKIKNKYKGIELEITDKCDLLCDGECVGEIIDGVFPPHWKHVLPENNGSVKTKLDKIGLNPEYLYNFYFVTQSMKKRGIKGSVKLNFYGDDNCIGIEIVNMPEFKGGLMPVK